MLEIASLVTGDKGNVCAVDVLLLRKTGVNCSLASEKKKKKFHIVFLQ